MTTEHEFSLIAQHIDALTILERVAGCDMIEDVDPRLKAFLYELFCGIRLYKSNLEDIRRELIDELKLVQDIENFLVG